MSHSISSPQERLDLLSIELGKEFDGLSVFAVGGIVLTLFTDHSTSDVDLMVTGVTPEEMLDREFTLIQNNETTFPVFLDSEGREVALARVERSTSSGHHGFEVKADPSVTVEEDLKRRDLTVNAMAVSLTDSDRFEAGALIDPFGGREDVNRGLIRMVQNESFKEDPLRILRMARFAARLRFEVEAETLSAARKHVEKLHDIPRERWGMEVVKAMKQASQPSKFFQLLDEVDALDIILPELAALQGVPAGPKEFHREGDAFVHTMLVLDEIAARRPDGHRAKFAALAHDLGKGLSPNGPSHPKHHVKGVDLMRDIQDRLVLSNELRGVMESASRFHMRMHNLDELRESTILQMVDRLQDDYEVSNPDDEPVITHITLDELIDLAEADAAGRIPASDFDRTNARKRFDLALRVIDEIDGSHIEANFEPNSGEHFGELLLQERVRALRNPEQFGIDS